MAFLDLEKAYDKVPTEVVYWCLRKRGVIEQLVKIVEATYNGAKTRIITQHGNTEPLESMLEYTKDQPSARSCSLLSWTH